MKYVSNATLRWALGALSVTTAGAALGAGPDLVITDMLWPTPDGGVERVASEAGESAYSIATFTCNIGDADAAWNGGTANHPLISQNLFRYHDGRFEQIGMAWPKHAAAVVSQAPSCGPCGFMGQVTFFLAPGCMDPYDASTNATQSRLSPRTDVNPATGVFAFPFDQSQPPSALDRRLRVPNDEIDPAAYPGARFFIEAQMIAADDAAAGNDLNNATHRELQVGAFFNGGFDMSPAAPAVPTMPAIFAWQEIDSDVLIERADVDGDGSFFVGSRATQNPGGDWSYEYAVLNFNSHRSAQGFSLPLDDAASVSAIGFHDVHYHSGETISRADWNSAHSQGQVAWSLSDDPLDPNANALRWGTLYNFRMRSERAPAEATATITLHLSGSPASVPVTVVAPASMDALPADLNSDGCVDSGDLAELLAAWDTPGADLTGDGVTDASDLAVLLAAWGQCL